MFDTFIEKPTADCGQSRHTRRNAMHSLDIHRPSHIAGMLLWLLAPFCGLIALIVFYVYLGSENPEQIWKKQRCVDTEKYSMKSVRIIVGGCMAGLTLTGCVERTITITSDPPGALVWLNDREIGRTPVDVGFVYYGTYDVRLEKDGHEPLMTKGAARPPWWDNIPVDFFAEVAPVDLHADVRWHYTLEQVREDRAALLDRAGELRLRIGAEPASPAPTQPGDQPAPPTKDQPDEASKANTPAGADP